MSDGAVQWGIIGAASIAVKNVVSIAEAGVAHAAAGTGRGWRVVRERMR